MAESNVHNNKMKMEFDSNSCNESLARLAVASFIMPLDPNLEEMNDIKTAVSEAVTNAIIHGYENTKGTVYMECELRNELLIIKISDKGKGIENVENAMQPMYTTKSDSGRAGMGFMFMDIFMDSLKVQSSVGIGTTVTMTKKMSRQWQEQGCDCGDTNSSF